MLWGIMFAMLHGAIGRKLVQAVLDHAADLAEQVHLDVSVGNEAAIALYQRYGFRRYGTTPRCMKIDATSMWMRI